MPQGRNNLFKLILAHTWQRHGEVALSQSCLLQRVGHSVRMLFLVWLPRIPLPSFEWSNQFQRVSSTAQCLGVPQGHFYVRSIASWAWALEERCCPWVNHVGWYVCGSSLPHTQQTLPLWCPFWACFSCFNMQSGLFLFRENTHDLGNWKALSRQWCLVLFCCETGNNVSQAGLTWFSCHHSGLCDAGDQPWLHAW